MAEPVAAATLPGPVSTGELTLCCPPRLLLAVFTVPVGSQVTTSREDPKSVTWQETTAGAVLEDMLDCEKLIRFSAALPGQDVDALDRAFVVVACNAPQWRVIADASDLVGEGGVVPAGRLSTRHWNSGGAYESLGQTVEVAAGGMQWPRVVNVMDFRARVEMTDPAGTYAGRLQFTGLISP